MPDIGESVSNASGNRLMKCPIETTWSELRPGCNVSRDVGIFLDRLRNGKRLSRKDKLAALIAVDMCELCPDYTFCQKKRWLKMAEIRKGFVTHL